jgi:GcrA cell cycle regulator
MGAGGGEAREGWTEDRVQRLTALWRAGRSAREVAAALGGVTRNAVIGKVFRLGLSAGRAAPARARAPSGPRGRQLRIAAPRRAPAAVPPALGPVVVELSPLAASVEGLRLRSCRWPIGDPKREGFGFCGRDAPAGPYCATHRSVAYQARPVDGEASRVRRRPERRPG